MTGARLSFLGPGEAVLDGRKVRLRSQKSLALLAYLALEGPTPREQLAELLWGTASGRSNLRVEVHRLERALPGVVQRGRSVLALGEAWVDVLAFEAAARAGEAAEAHALYRGPFLEGLSGGFGPELEEWIAHQRARLRELRREVLGALARRAEPREAVALWLARLADDPLDETACRGAMEAYLRLEQPGQALKVYHGHAAFLERELGLPPEAETRALAEFIRSGRPKPRARGPRFAGRDVELRRLEAAYVERKGVFISGEPGIGKTRLALEFARAKGLEPFWLRGRPGDAEVPYATLARTLRQVFEMGADPDPWARKELARLLPELGPPPAEKNPTRLLAALAHALEPFAGPGWLWGIDDLQFVDAASLSLIAGLPGLLEDRPGVVTYRSGTLGPEAAAWVENWLLQEKAVELVLRPLSTEAVARMLDVDAERAADLNRRTGGNPFFLSRLAGGEDGSGRDLHALVSGRLQTAPAPARRLCELAAVAGTAFGPELAGAVLEMRPLALAEASDELERLGLFRRGQPAHDLVTEGVLAGMPEAALAYWHLSVAEALERLPGAAPAAVAHHFERAGHPQRAAGHRLAAARAAEQAFAYREALEQYRLAVDTAPPGARDEIERATLEPRFRIHLALLDWEGARSVLELAGRLADRLDDAELALQLRLGHALLQFSRGDLEAALEGVEDLVEEEAIEPRLRAEARYIRAVALQARGEHEPALDDVLQALELNPDPDWVFHGWAHNTAAISWLARGEAERAAAHNRTAAAHFRRWGDLAGEANARRVDAEIAAAQGDGGEAERRYDEALELARRAGHQGVLGYVLASALLFFERAGRGERVRALAREGHGLEGPYRAFFARRLAE